MPRILILYYSRTGNTEKMAKAVAEGAQSLNTTEVAVEYHVEASDLTNYDAIIVGTSTYNHQLPIDIKNVFDEASAQDLNLRGKKGAAFGSYGWTGEAPNIALEIMKKLGITVNEPPVLARYDPDRNSLNQCKELGKRVSESLIHKP